MDSSLSLSFDFNPNENGSSAGAPSKQCRTPAEQLHIPAKKARSASQNGNPPRCQVEGCGVDLSSAKAYHLRHRVCGVHSKSPKVKVGGLEQRFCQQCSRFHELPEFDEGKRSCRRRLAGHNQRRRKPQPIQTALLRHPTRFATASPLYGQLGPTRTNGLRDHIIHFEAELPLQMFNSNPHKISPNSMQGHVAEVSPQGYLHDLGRSSGERYLGMLDSGCALSLLSTEWKGAGSPGDVLAGVRPFTQSFQNLNLGLVPDELLGIYLQSSNLPTEAHMAQAPWS